MLDIKNNNTKINYFFNSIKSIFAQKPLVVFFAINIISNFISAHDFQITYVTTAINLGRPHHGGQGMGSGEYRFEDDYLVNLKCFLQLGWPCRVYMQGQYFDAIKEYIHPRAEIVFFELDDLRLLKHYQRIQELRPMLHGTGRLYPQHLMELYVPLVMNKVDLLYQTAMDNPFNTEYFVWLDSNFHVRSIHKENHSRLVDYLDKFAMHYFHQYPADDIHGMLREEHIKYCSGINSDHVCRAMIFGGTQKAIVNFHASYHYFLEKSLAEGNMGTEENIMTFCYFADPEAYYFWEEPLMYSVIKK